MGVYALTTMPMVFFSTEFHWQSEKKWREDHICFTHVIKSVLGVSSFPKEQTKKKASYFSPPFLWEISVNIQQASTGRVGERPCS